MRVRVEGLRELDRALGELPKATGKNVLRRTGLAALEPMRADAERNAPVLSGQLKASVLVSPRQKTGRALRRYRDDADTVTVFMGPSREGVVQGQMQEFGTFKEPAQPYMRPAWDRHKDDVPFKVGEALWDQIQAAAQRLARKAARRGG